MTQQVNVAAEDPYLLVEFATYGLEVAAEDPNLLVEFATYGLEVAAEDPNLLVKFATRHLEVAAAGDVSPPARRQVLHQYVRFVDTQDLDQPLVQRSPLRLTDHHALVLPARQLHQGGKNTR